MTITKISHRIALSRIYSYQNAVVEWATEATVADGEKVEEAKKTLKTTGAWYFAVHAANPAASVMLRGDAYCMNARQFIGFQYRLRRIEVPDVTRAHINTLPDEKTPRCWFADSKNDARQPKPFKG